MSLPELKLDDLNWQQMVEGLRSRIVAQSQGNWTMHAPVDPGVTLIELFAYLFEQRLYWMDQIPEQTASAILAMLDDARQPTQAAQTLLSLAPIGDSHANLTPGTLFHSKRLDTPQPLTVREALTVLPIAQSHSSSLAHGANLSVSVNGKDRSMDMYNMQSLALLPSDHGEGQWSMTLWLTRKLDPTEIGGRCNILLELESPTQIQPDWAPVATELRWSNRNPQAGYDTTVADNEIPGACGLTLFEPIHEVAGSVIDTELGEISSQWALDTFKVDAPAKLEWSYGTGGGSRSVLSDTKFDDGTGGLRRSGVLRFEVPTDWRPDDNRPVGPFPYTIFVDCESCSFSSPPTLRRAVPNVVLAQNVKAIDVPWSVLEPIMTNFQRLPGQNIALPAGELPPIENRIRLQLLESDGEWHLWRTTEYFYRHGPEDRVFEVDRARSQLKFGNGLTGRIPVLLEGVENARLCYLSGGGEEGNIGQQSWQSSTLDNATLSVVDPLGATNAELITQAQARLARGLQRVERAVKKSDYESLATSTPGVAIARAHAAVASHPDFPCKDIAGAVTVFIVPEVARPTDIVYEDISVPAPRSDPGEVAAAAARLQARRLIGQEVFVRPATYRAVNLVIALDGIVLDETELSTSVERQLAAFLDPLIGGADASGWPFGEPIRPSTLMQKVQALLDQGVSVSNVEASLDDEGFESCHEVDIGEHNLVYLASIDIQISRRSAARGGLL